MYSIVYKQSVTDVVMIALALVIIVIVLQSISRYFLQSVIVFYLLVALCLFIVVRAIGIFIMYPGTYKFMTAQIEKNQSDFLFSNIHRDLNKLNQICQILRNKTLQKLKDSYHRIYGSEICQSLKMQAKVIERASTQNLVRCKIVQLYGQLLYLLSKPLRRGKQQNIQQRDILERQISKREEDNDIQRSCLSIKNIMNNPYQIRQVDSEELVIEINDIVTQIRDVCRNIWSLLVSMSSINSLEHRLGDQKPDPKILKESSFNVANWHLFKEKLFTTDSFYAYWDNLFEYSTFTIQVQPSIFIQCAIIHRDKLMSKTRFNYKVAVLFNNPNGAIFQALALSSSYISFYLKLGFQIVLWNYRGYAKSNGFSSCRHSISDVCKIYKQATIKFGLNIQVIHGYSIGGVSAISLTHQINRSNRGQIKLLIADRTFSSIDRVAKGFISTTNLVFRAIHKASRTIVKFFLYSQCINNALIFAQCECEKVIIHDFYDQIISDEGSIKRELLQLALRQHNSIPQNLSVEELSCSPKFNQFQMQQIVIKYAQSLSALHGRNRRAYESVLRILFDTDGAGFHINMQEDLELQNGRTNISKQRIMKDSKQYFVGLILYGPKNGVPNLPTLWGEEQWRRKRIAQRIKLLCEYEKKVGNTIDQQDIRCIIDCLNYTVEQHSQQNNRAKRQKYGYLIVSKVGHNSELKSEYVELENILKNVYPEVLAKK